MPDFTNGISARQGAMERMKCNFAGILPEIPMHRTKARAEWAAVPRRPVASRVARNIERASKKQVETRTRDGPVRPCPVTHTVPRTRKLSADPGCIQPPASRLGNALPTLESCAALLRGVEPFYE